MQKEQLKIKYKDQKVYVLEDTFICDFDKQFEDMSKESYRQLLNQKGEFIYRYDAELDTRYRQLIPYCILKSAEKYFVTKRLGGDSRLVGQYAIGVGGHIEDMDGLQDDDLILNGLNRELSEEVEIRSKIENIKLTGTIYSNATEVDRVHYGLVFVISLDGCEVDIKEKHKLEGIWVTYNELNEMKDNLEMWSKICIDSPQKIDYGLSSFI